jgi:hypothetical protein
MSEAPVQPAMRAVARLWHLARHMSILMITPNDDALSRVAGKYGRAIVEQFSADAKPLIVDVLSRSAIDRQLANGSHVLYFGHGERDALVSRRYRWWPWSSQQLCDEHNLPSPGRIVIAIACWSADTLGPKLVEENMIEAYVGWPDRFSWPESCPEPVWDAVTSACAVLAQGGTLDNFVSELQRGLYTAHNYLREELSWNPFAAMWTFYNAGRIYLGGNAAAQLV